MDIFSKNKFLVRVVWALIVLNIASMSFFWIKERGGREKPRQEEGRPRKHNIEQLTAILTDELKLTHYQQIGLKNLREDFFRKEKELSARIKAGRDSMNELMFNEVSDSLQIAGIARRVADNEFQMELYRMQQAQQFKAFCTPEQLKKFEGLVKEIRDYFQPEKKR